MEKWCPGSYVMSRDGFRKKCPQSLFTGLQAVSLAVPPALPAVARESIPVAHLFAQLDASHLSSPDPHHLCSF